MALSKVMEDKLDMKQFRLFLRTLRMIYNFYEVQKNTYNRCFFSFVEVGQNQVKLFKTVP